MRRLGIICGIFVLILLIAGLGRTAVDPDSFTGQWYYSGDQRVYQFHEGLIFSSQNTESLLRGDSFQGAYTFCKDSVYLYVTDIEGLEEEKTLYLLHKDDGSFLCDNKDGTGEIYFIRYDK